MHTTSRRLELLFHCLVLAACGGGDHGAARAAPPAPEPPAAEPPAAPGPSAAPALLTVLGAHVESARESLRSGDPRFQEALTVLQKNAEGALALAPVSVMDKGATPPSGDKHDYMSQAPYYWPDPSKPDGVPYIEKDGERNPEVDRITDHDDLNRVYRAVSTLGLAYYLTGREDYAEQAARLVRVWFLDPATRMNPHLEFAQGIPGIAKGRSAGIIETRFLPNIIDGVMLLQGSPAWTAADDQGFKDWMHAYLEWLRTSQRGREQANRGNNQETWYDVQVVSLAIYTGETEAARTTLLSGQAAIGGQFERDGRQPRELRRTRAWDYSVFNLNAFMQLAALGDRVGVDLWNYRSSTGRSLRRGVDYLVPFATGDERFPYEQITEFRPSALHRVLRWAAVGWNEPRYRELATQIGGETATLELTLP